MELLSSQRSPLSTARSAMSGDLSVEYIESESDYETKSTPRDPKVTVRPKSPSSTTLLKGTTVHSCPSVHLFSSSVFKKNFLL